MKHSRYAADNINTYANPKQIAISANSLVFYCI